MKNNNIQVLILTYPGVMQSAVQGLNEIFNLTNDLCRENHLNTSFTTILLDIESIKHNMQSKKRGQALSSAIVIIPPSLGGTYYLNPEPTLKTWLIQQHSQGVLICSVCAGAFILAASGLLHDRVITTHWQLASLFAKNYSEITLNTNKILINDGDIITAGGLMSWLDLGLELVVQFTNSSLMRQLGRLLIVDTALREQKYYQSFTVNLDHGDEEILKAQHYMQVHFKKVITVKSLASFCCLGERTFLRRFVKATELKPAEYLQRLRVQKACDLLETTKDSFEKIAFKIGYQDLSACRKIFIKTMGLTPRDFRNRFSH